MGAQNRKHFTSHAEREKPLCCISTFIKHVFKEIRCPSCAVTSPLTLDTNTAHPLLSISDDLRSVTRVTSRLPCASHHERFDHWPQVLTAQTFSSGTHYWELEAEGFWDIGVCYRNIGRKGKEGNAFGINKVQVSVGVIEFLSFSADHTQRTYSHIPRKKTVHPF